MNIPSEKTRIRRDIIKARKAIGSDVRAVLDRRVRLHLFESAAWQNARALFCYVSSGWEISTREIISEALAAGKRVAAPLCLGNGIMEAREISSMGDLRLGMLGIDEPLPHCGIIKCSEIDLAIVPALAFGRDASRLGRGGGYYDRYLRECRCIKAGLCYEDFLFDSLPQEPHDVCADLVFTEKRMYAWE